VTAIPHRTIALCLIATFGSSALASPSSQQDPAVVEAVRRQVQGFQQYDRLKVKLHDGSKKTGCLTKTEQDGFFIGWGPDSAATRILYGDVADVKKDKRGPLQNALRGVVSVAAVGGAVLGVMKIGSNTPKTMAVKVPAAVAVGYTGAYAAASQTCR
jgi:hypothetical protein